jgi:hypothetical protein
MRKNRLRWSSCSSDDPQRPRLCRPPAVFNPEFFENKPVDVLIGPGIAADELNDDTLGACAGRSSTNMERRSCSHRLRHMHATCLVYGHPRVIWIQPRSALSGKYLEDDEEPTAVSITHGWSKDAQPDLKQLMVVLLCAYKSQIPTWFAVQSGNKSDKVSLVESIEQLSSTDQRRA